MFNTSPVAVNTDAEASFDEREDGLPITLTTEVLAMIGGGEGIISNQ